MASIHKRTFADYDSLSREVAEELAKKIRRGIDTNGRFVLGCATGSTPVKMYSYLVAFIQQEPFDLSNFYTVNLDEDYPVKESDPNSYFQYMRHHLWDPLHTINHTFDYHRQGFILTGETDEPVEECLLFEEAIQNLGGVDIQILGVGLNGHIGFNEPDSPPDSRTRLITVDETTRHANAIHFSGIISRVPKQALTMGIATILEAKEIMVLANGPKKMAVIERIFDSPHPDPSLPASYLHQHHHVSYCLCP
jgi:glucosamine-6-phosphate deaminase